MWISIPLIGFVLVIVLLFILSANYERKRRNEALANRRTVSILPWQFVAIEAVVQLLERFFLRRTLGIPTVDKLIADARKETGLVEFFDEQFVRRQVGLLIDAVSDQTSILFIGRVHLSNLLRRQIAIQLLLRESQRLQRKPKALPKPIWIIGLPRSGTTRLFHLMSLDKRAESVPYWQLVHPMPSPCGSTDLRAKELRKTLARAPLTRLVQVHQFGADIPEEDDLLLRNSMLHPHIDTHEFESDELLNEWHQLRANDRRMQQAYREHRILLESIVENRYLSHDSHLILKSTIHGAFLQYLVGFYPDALFIQTHRDPMSSVLSMAHLRCCLSDTLMRSVDAPAVAKRIAQFEAWHMQRLIAYRRSLPTRVENRSFFDVKFNDVNKNPIAVVERIYEHFGLELTSEHVAAMKQYLADNPSTSSAGAFDKSLFALDQSYVDGLFADYTSHFAAMLK